MNAELRQSLREILTEILREEEPRPIAAPGLAPGFGPLPPKQRADYIFVKAQEGGPGCWYRLTGSKDSPQVEYLDPVNQAAITGFLIDCALIDVQTTFGLAVKLDLTLMVGEQRVIIRTGATAFAEGALRSLLAAPQIKDLLTTVAVVRADRSDKALFAEIFVAGQYYLPDPESPRLITWAANDKPRRNEILETFLPAVNKVRSNLGLTLMTEPANRDAEPAATVKAAASTSPLVTEILALIKNLGWEPPTVVAFLRKNFKVDKISLLSEGQKLELKNVLIMASNAPGDYEEEDDIPF